MLDAIMPSVVYRDTLTAEDYDEAIEALQDAKRQDECSHMCCSVCHDTGHLAHQCHHNPLLMARRAVTGMNVWRCYHCDAIFNNNEDAAEHFGLNEHTDPACFDKPPSQGSDE